MGGKVGGGRLALDTAMLVSWLRNGSDDSPRFIPCPGPA